MTGFITFIIVIACVCSCCYRLSSNHTNTAAPSIPIDDMTQGPSCRYLEYRVPGKTGDVIHTYRFQIKRVGSEYRAYILESPNYNHRATDAHSTHRHFDGTYYICWSSPVRNQDDMVNIAQQWATCTQRYIDYGTRF